MANPLSLSQSVQADFDGGGQGGGKRGKIFKIVGIGCLAVFLVGALLTGLGVFKAVRFCSDIADYVGQAELARERGYEFALALHEERYEAAYEMLSAEAKGELSPQEFEEVFADWESALTTYPPWQRGVLSRDEDDTTDMMRERRFNFEFPFMGHEGGEGLAMRITLRAEGEGEETQTFVEGWLLEPRVYNLQSDILVSAVSRYFTAIIRGNFEESRRYIANDSPLAAMSEEEYGSFAEELRGRLGEVAIYGLNPFEMRRLDPAGDMKIQVTVRLKGAKVDKIAEIVILRDTDVFEVVSVRDVEEEDEPAVEEEGIQGEEGAEVEEVAPLDEE